MGQWVTIYVTGSSRAGGFERFSRGGGIEPGYLWLGEMALRREGLSLNMSASRIGRYPGLILTGEDGKTESPT